MEISFLKSKPQSPLQSGLRPKSFSNPLSMSVSGEFPSHLSAVDEDDGFTLLDDPKVRQRHPIHMETGYIAC